MRRNRDLMATPPYYISAYGIWLKLGNQGTEQDFIDSLQGADGEKTLIQYNGATGNLEWKHENGESWAVLLSFTDIISQGEADVIAACLTHANTAQLHSETAAGYAEDAQGYASAASASKTAAKNSAASAANHANNASASETAAAGSVAAAAGSASTAASKANEAAASATTAQNSVSAAAAQASAAAGSAASASGYASAASTSAGEAAASAAAAQAAASGMLPTNYETLTNKPSIGGTTLSGALTLAALKIQAELVAGTNVTLTPRADGKVTISAAGGSGTSDYTALTNKPQINSVELSGNKSLTDLGIASATALAGKQDKLTAGTNITISGTTISATDTKDYNALSNRPQIAGVTLSGNKTLAQLGIAPATHTHSEYAAVAHNHDSSYAAATHVHAGYAQVLVFQNISVAASAWGSDSTYTDYPFSATVTATGVTADYLPEVIFGAVEAAGGSFAPVALSGAGTVKIYAKAKPTAAITIPSILCTKAVT